MDSPVLNGGDRGGERFVGSNDVVLDVRVGVENGIDNGEGASGEKRDFGDDSGGDCVMV